MSFYTLKEGIAFDCRPFPEDGSRAVPNNVRKKEKRNTLEEDHAKNHKQSTTTAAQEIKVIAV